MMRELKVDPKIAADLMGHDIGVNLNVDTQTSDRVTRKRRKHSGLR
jgi:hypothetical protein